VYAGTVVAVVGATQHRERVAADGIEVADGAHPVEAARHDLERHPPVRVTHRGHATEEDRGERPRAVNERGDVRRAR
jgi:hypothetical protein